MTDQLLLRDINADFEAIQETVRTSSAAAIKRYRALPRDRRLLVVGCAARHYARSLFWEMLLKRTSHPHVCGLPEFGAYTGQIELVPPPALVRPDGRGICVDVCLALEVARLWSLGIVTTGNCCGHGRAAPYIGVIEACIDQMLASRARSWLGCASSG